MTNPVLRLGRTSPAVARLAELLAMAGYNPGKRPVSVFTAEVERAVKQFQQDQGLLVDGVVGDKTWGALIAECEKTVTPIPEPAVGKPYLTAAAEQLVMEFEVGGGKKYYDLRLARPTWPGVASGVTIGIGYDLGYNTEQEFLEAWQRHLSPIDFHLLAGCVGLRNGSASMVLPKVREVYVPFAAALEVFQRVTVPKFARMTEQAFPGAWAKLPHDAWGALFSLVYNRGAKMDGDRRREMRKIRELIQSEESPDLLAIAQQVKSMCRLWVDVPGLIRRRNAEAALILKAAGK